MLSVTAFGAGLPSLYHGYVKGDDRLGQIKHVTDPSAYNLYNDLIFVSGAPGSASASGYGSFYMYRNAANSYKYQFGYANPLLGGDGNTYTDSDLKPIGNIKWVLYDGVLVITNDWTEAEVEAQINRNADEVLQDEARKSMTRMNLLNAELSYLELTVFRNNPNIETIIIGDNIDYNLARSVFIDCENIKNIICLDSGFHQLVEGSSPEYIIVDGGERSGEYYGGSSGKYGYTKADWVAYQGDSSVKNFVAYTPGTKGNVSIGIPTRNEKYTEETGWVEWWT